MSTDNFTQFQVGDSVRVRPHLALPTTPRSVEGFTAPFFYPGRITETISAHPPMFVVRLARNPFSRVWAPRQAFKATEIHRTDCVCGVCGEYAQSQIDVPLATPGDLVIQHDERQDGQRLVWVGHPLTVADLGEVLAYELAWTNQPLPELTREGALEMLASALSWRGLESTRHDHDAPPTEVLNWGQAQARRLFGSGERS